MYYRIPLTRDVRLSASVLHISVSVPRIGVSARFAKLFVLPCVVSLFLFVVASQSHAQTFEREIPAGERARISIRNLQGGVRLIASHEPEQNRIIVQATSPTGGAIGESDVRIEASNGFVEIETMRGDTRARIDLVVRVPRRARISIITDAGAVDAAGNLEEATVETDTGTIHVDVPLDSVRYDFVWRASRPRFFSAVELSAPRERAAGRFEIEGRIGDRDAERADRVRLNLTTRRGIILFGVDPSEVPADLRERPLTEAARAVIRNGNETLIDAIRRVAPRNVAEFVGEIPQRHMGGAPLLLSSRIANSSTASTINEEATTTGSLATSRLVRLNVNVTDAAGRAIGGLTAADFKVFENGELRTVTDVVQSDAPFNLVLLLDVSGSVEERLDFIRRAALRFINTASAQDRIAIISFRDDVQVISNFTTDRALLTARTNLIEAGGATALYDALAYSIVDTLRPLRGERVGIVVLSDGDDNKSFLPFPAVLEAVIESGALLYPLYVPSGLIRAGSSVSSSSASNQSALLDPTRARYLTITTRADEEGRQLAEASGGVFYPITRLDDLQRAFTDIVMQVRAAYTITYQSEAGASDNRRVRVRVERGGAQVRPGPGAQVRSATR